MGQWVPGKTVGRLLQTLRIPTVYFPTEKIHLFVFQSGVRESPPDSTKGQSSSCTFDTKGEEPQVDGFGPTESTLYNLQILPDKDF